MDSASPMALCLIGQGELRRRLRLQVFAAIARRITMRYHLSELIEGETKGYYQHTKGIPRQVNNLCTAALLAGFDEQRKDH